MSSSSTNCSGSPGLSSSLSGAAGREAAQLAQLHSGPQGHSSSTEDGTPSGEVWECGEKALGTFGEELGLRQSLGVGVEDSFFQQDLV